MGCSQESKDRKGTPRSWTDEVGNEGRVKPKCPACVKTIRKGFPEDCHGRNQLERMVAPSQESHITHNSF